MSPPSFVAASRDHRVADLRLGEMRELASGVDSLYLSGRVEIPTEFVIRLDESKTRAQESGVNSEIDVGPITFTVPPFGLTRRYPHRLDHEWCAIGVAVNARRYPTLRYQPRAEFIHAVGAEKVVQWCRDALAPVMDDVVFGVSRVDLFADWQGWEPEAADKARFVSRARAWVSYDYDDAFTGFTIGRRNTSTLVGRIYNKSKDAEDKHVTYWPLLWGAAHDPSRPVWRTEFEFNRNILHDFRVSDPHHTLASAGDLWEYATNWLSLRDPAADQTKARWPVAPEWERVRRASLARAVIGIDRVRAERWRGSIDDIVPGLAGYLTTAAAILGHDSLDGLLPDLRRRLREFEIRSGRSFSERVAEKRRARML